MVEIGDGVLEDTVTHVAVVARSARLLTLYNAALANALVKNNLRKRDTVGVKGERCTKRE